MRAFYDLEFAENGPQIPIKLISVGIVTEDGQEFYGINEECLSTVMMDRWLRANVAASLPIAEDQTTPGGGIFFWDTEHEDYQHVLPLGILAERLAVFLQGIPDLELWAYYGAYDHVVLCQNVFGKMADLPPGIPMWTHDLMQLAELHGPAGTSLFPPQPSVAHNALHDARWNREAYLVLTSVNYEDEGGRHEAPRHAARPEQDINP